jgi:uncharacterized membrane protein (UPF0127 family)
LIRGVLYRADNPEPLLSDVMHTSNTLERMRGLLGRPPLQPHQALLIRPCSSVHTFGMRYPIDLVFLDENWRIIKLVHALRPRRITWAWGAQMVIELAGGILSRLNLTPQTQLRWEKHACA